MLSIFCCAQWGLEKAQCRRVAWSPQSLLQKMTSFQHKNHMKRVCMRICRIHNIRSEKDLDLRCLSLNGRRWNNWIAQYSQQQQRSWQNDIEQWQRTTTRCSYMFIAFTLSSSHSFYDMRTRECNSFLWESPFHCLLLLLLIINLKERP